MQNIKKSIIFLIFTLVCFVFTGCTSPDKKVTIDGHEFNLSIAKNSSQRAKGLADVSTLKNNEGMLFLFDKKEIQTFWMKDTLIPLQIIFIDGCKIVDIQEMSVEKNPANPSIHYDSKFAADKAIELNKSSLPDKLIGREIPELCKFII